MLIFGPWYLRQVYSRTGQEPMARLPEMNTISGYEARMASTTTKNHCWSLITTSHTKQLVTTAKDECNSEVVVAPGGCVYQWTTHSSRASRGIGLKGYSHHNKVTNGLKLEFPLVWTPNRFHSWCIEISNNLEDSEDHLVSDNYLQLVS